MCQISRQLEYAFAFYSNFFKCAKTMEKKKKSQEKTETLAACNSEMAGAISFKFGM